MKIRSYRVANLPLCYAVAVHDSPRGKRVICAAQGPAGAVDFSAVDGGDIEQAWGEPGGTMTVLPLGNDEFLATTGMYTGIVSRDCRVNHVARRADGTYVLTPYLALDYLHRFCLADAAGEKWLVAASLCGRKESRDDWSRPGAVYVTPYAFPAPGEFRQILGGVHRNHGMYCGPFAGGERTILVTGTEGAFIVAPPDRPGGEWTSERFLDFEISDILPFDIDGDGEDELITVEGFHGDRVNIYKKKAEAWERTYSYPVAWGHSLWAGSIFGKPGLLVGYNGANAALLLLTPKRNRRGFSMEPLLIDELQAYNNIAVWDDGERIRVYAACRSDDIMMYTLER